MTEYKFDDKNTKIEIINLVNETFHNLNLLKEENEQLKAKLENTERKIRTISQKCYEVENIESIISDLDNLAMELGE